MTDSDNIDAAPRGVVGADPLIATVLTSARAADIFRDRRSPGDRERSLDLAREPRADIDLFRDRPRRTSPLTGSERLSASPHRVSDFERPLSLDLERARWRISFELSAPI